MYKAITAPDNCTGCGLCSNICSRNAISMHWNTDGFLVPTVDPNSCINCGLCAKKCPALSPSAPVPNDMDDVISYAGWNCDADKQKLSSSGGLFTALAESVFKDGGCVFGVVWRDKMTAAFDKAETPEELSFMRSSKYTQALTDGVYRLAKKELQTGRKVLFSGTSCQIHALLQFLGKTEYPNLITVDILCHGVPSHLLLEKYVKEAEKTTGKTIKYISFRDKVIGWENYHVRTLFTDGTSILSPIKKDFFMRTFLADKVLNKACYNCKFRCLPRVADISLGDYWGVQHKEPEWPINRGISSILANTEKGKSFLQTLGDLAVLKQEHFSNIYKGQPTTYILNKEHTPPKDRDMFLSLLKTVSLKKIYSKLMYAFDLGFVHISYRSGIYKLFCKLTQKSIEK